MDTPRGFNPVGQSAPGLPRHDAPLPGHVPGAPSLPLGGGDAPTPANGGFNTAYTGPGLPLWVTQPIARFFFFLWVYLFAPVVAALYPIAGAAGLVGAGLFYLLARIMGGGYDTTHGWAWTGCFLGVVALMRTETRLEGEIPRGDAIQMPNCVARVLRAWAKMAANLGYGTSRKKCNLDAILVSA